MFECVSKDRLEALVTDASVDLSGLSAAVTDDIRNLAHGVGVGAVAFAMRSGGCAACLAVLNGLQLGIRLERAWREEQELAALMARPAGERP